MAGVIRSSIVPIVNNPGTPTSNAVWIVFDDSLDTGTVNADTFKLFRISGDFSPLGGTFNFATTTFANDTLVFAPDLGLAPGETVEAVLTDGVTVNGMSIAPYDAKLTLGTASFDSGAGAFVAADSGVFGDGIQSVTPPGRFDQPAPTPPPSAAESADAFGVPTSIKTVAATGDNNIDGLLDGTAWLSNAVTFSFPDSMNDYETGYSPGYTSNPVLSFQALNSTQQAAARDWLGAGGEYANVSGLTPSELTGASDKDATIRMAMSDDPYTAYAYFPAATVEGGDAWFNPYDYNTPVIGGYAYHTFGHELGHALGLKHGHETGGAANVAMNADRDSMEFSVMTYRSYVGHDLDALPGYVNEEWGFAQTLMMYDIAAIQEMYGPNFSYASGNNIYTFSTATGEMFIDGIGQGTPGGNRVFRTVWDGDGTDTYDLSNYSTKLSIDLSPGGWSDFDVGGASQRAVLDDWSLTTQYARGHLFNALEYHGDARSLIENAIGGTGDDIILGNAADNALTGGDGDDSLTGGAGSDTAVYSGNAADYTVTAIPGGYHIVRNGGGGEGADDLYGVEFLQFANGTFAPDAVPCFLRGTRVLTRTGYRPVEALRVGDELQTLGHGWLPLRWIGRRRMAPHQGRSADAATPVRIKPDALGPGLPARDVWVSPDHALFFRHHLIPAKALVNGVSILRDHGIADIEYFHLLLDRHAVVFSEGLPTESYVPSENLHQFENGDTCPLDLAVIFQIADCFPRAAAGPLVESCKALILRGLSRGAERLAG